MYPMFKCDIIEENISDHNRLVLQFDFIEGNDPQEIELTNSEKKFNIRDQDVWGNVLLEQLKTHFHKNQENGDYLEAMGLTSESQRDQ